MSESKYMVFLKPIRDLAETWSIDIAMELEDYLKELADLEFSIDDGAGKRLNFAEAALVIQGSANVYVKKVEFLHSLVYRALEDIRTQKKGKDGDAQAAAGAGPAARAADRHQDAWDDEDQFLSLDDCLEEGRDIDLDEGEGGDAEGAGGPAAHRLRPPPSVVTLLAAGERGGDESAAPRLSFFSVHVRSGALLIDEADGRALDSRLRPVVTGQVQVQGQGQPSASGAGPSSSAGTAVASPGAAAGSGAGPSVDPRGFASPIMAPMDAADSDGDDPAPPLDFNYDYEGGGGDDGYGGQEDGAMAMEGAAHQAGAGGQAQPGAVPTGALVLPGAQSPAAPAAGQAAAEEEEEEEEADPWAPLDMYARAPLPVRPLRKGRPPRRKARPQREAAAPTDTYGQMLAGLMVPGGPTNSGPLMAEFVDVMAEIQKVRKAKDRAARAQARNGPGGRMEGPEAVNVALGPEPLPLDAGDEDEDEAEGFQFDFGFGGGMDDYGPEPSFGEMAAGGAEGPPAGDAEVDGPANDGLEAAVREHNWLGLTPRRSPGGGLGGLGFPTPHRGPGAAPFTPGGDAPYEDLVRRHMEDLMARAASAQVQTRLQRSVSTWRDKVEPALAEQDARGAFDIHKVADRLVGRLAEAGKAAASQGDLEEEEEGGEGAEVPFAALCGTENRWEVSRGFSALLQLINNGNVQLKRREGTEAEAIQAEARGRGRAQRAQEADRPSSLGGVVLGAADLVLVLKSADLAQDRFNDFSNQVVAGVPVGPPPAAPGAGKAANGKGKAAGNKKSAAEAHGKENASPAAIDAAAVDDGEWERSPLRKKQARGAKASAR